MEITQPVAPAEAPGLGLGGMKFTCGQPPPPGWEILLSFERQAGRKTLAAAFGHRAQHRRKAKARAWVLGVGARTGGQPVALGAGLSPWESKQPSGSLGQGHGERTRATLSTLLKCWSGFSH